MELTDLVVSAGRYGTGTVLIPPDREYLKICELLEDVDGVISDERDLRSELDDTPGARMVEDDKVGAGDMGLVLTDPTLYLQYSVQ